MKRTHVHRLAAVAVASLAVVALGGCPPPGEGEGEVEPPIAAEGEGELPPPVGGAFTPAPAAAALVLPWDAAPSPDGTLIYYTALGANGEDHSLWRTQADGGGTPVELAGGLVLPLSLVVSRDGATVFFVDVGVDDEEAGDSGAIYSIPADGGAPVELAGTFGFRARGLDVRDDALVFTGTDPADGQRGVFTVEGGAVNAVAKGASFDDPSGIAAARTGELYVIDSSSGEDGRGTVLRVDADGNVGRVAAGLDVGTPAGCALTLDEGTLFVSGRDAAEGQAQVYVVGLADGAVQTVSTGLEGNDESGGLHRAHDVDEYAWAGVSTVYRITFQ